MDGKITFKKFFKHLHIVNKHRFKVFCLCCKAGVPYRGLIHDLSKYTPTEFFEGVRYYVGTFSPIANCKKINGYSKAWLHHKGRNKHHYEYWYDYALDMPTPIIPYPYFVEMVCDSFAAGMIYQGKEWTKEYQLSYWKRTKKYVKIHPNMEKLLTKIYTDVSIYGLNPVINSKNLKKLYHEYMIEPQGNDNKNKKEHI